MINKSLTYLKAYLTEKINDYEVELGSLNRDGQPVEGDIVITLVRIEEERSTPSLNMYQYAKDGNGNNSAATTVNPPMILNLYVLITAQTENYETSLSLISKVVSTFHAKRFFEAREIGIEEIDSLALDLFSPSYEQNNSLWQTLGVKMMPAVMYKVRAIVVSSRAGEEKRIIGKVIIESTEKRITNI